MSNMYRMMNGVNPATFFILPMLAEKHPDSYPRFRDCFISKHEEQDTIRLFTRLGSMYHGDGSAEELLKHPNFLFFKDSEEDNTYAEFVYSVPEEWKEDYTKIVNGKLALVSDAYKKRLYAVFPKLKEHFDNVFSYKPSEVEFNG